MVIIYLLVGNHCKIKIKTSVCLNKFSPSSVQYIFVYIITVSMGDGVPNEGLKGI